ncbi:MAG TPA: Gmad2 immunoglobulin-like domain-containing protein [Actinomycetota bacterium]|nr:Gmad2 immunoglobulin-like domain-containing protein [Actinomycetota bacterium]
MNTEDKLRQMMLAARVEENATHAEWASFLGRAHRPLYARRLVVTIGTLAVIGIGVFAGTNFLSDDPAPVPLPPARTPTAEPTPTPEAPATAEVPPSEQELWFVQTDFGETLSWGSTVMGGEVSTEVAGDDPVAQKAAFWFDILLAGAQGPFQEAGDTTAIPDGTELLHVARDGSVLEVDLSDDFEAGGGSLSMQMRVAQIVYTGTQFEGIESVRILIEGGRVDAIGGEGVPAGGERRDFENVAPAIVLESPKPGDEVSNPVTISGFANTFEANVVIRIRDANGDVLVETFTTATCGSGCWGDFSEDVRYEVTEPQEGRIEVLTYSAEDGSERDVISTPVFLTP